MEADGGNRIGGPGERHTWSLGLAFFQIHLYCII
jgi:hypothetical protein